jgi:hypothetical protein
MNNATRFYPRALSYVSKVNEASDRGKECLVSCSGPDYRLALDLARAGLVKLEDRGVRNRLAYYHVKP